MKFDYQWHCRVLAPLLAVRPQPCNERLIMQSGMTASVGCKANCWHNALTESFFISLNSERMHGTRCPVRC